MRYRFSYCLFLYLLLISINTSYCNPTLAFDKFIKETNIEIKVKASSESMAMIDLISNPQDKKQELNPEKSSNPEGKEKTKENDSTVSSSVEKEEKEEQGFIKKLFTSATKSEKAAKKEAKTLKNIEKKEIRIYGWHPFWMTNSYDGYQYNLLTTLSYFSIDAYYDSTDATVKYNDNQIDSKNARYLLNQASRAGCRLDVTFKCQDKNAVYLLLNNEVVRDSCIKYIVRKLDSNYKFDGVCIVFENIPTGNSGSLLLFMATLRAELETKNQTLKLALPAVDFARNFDILKLNKVVDEYVMMGYNYHHKGTVAGPVTPLVDSSQKFHLKASVKEYLKNGVPYNKFIVALPYFGIVWQKHGSDTSKYRFKEHKSYSQIKEHLIATNARVKYNSKTYSYYYDYHDSANSTSYRCYFDNAESLAKKYKWVIKQGVAGVGIWALGYDHGSMDFWRMIDKNFQVVKLPPISKKIDIINRYRKIDSTFNSKDSTFVKSHTLLINDTIQDTLLRGLLHGDVAKPKPPEKQTVFSEIFEMLSDYFGPLFKSQKVVTIVVMTLLIFGFSGLLASLLFESVRELIYILSLPGYIFANIILVLSAFTLFSFLEWFKPELKELFPQNHAEYYCEVYNGIWFVIVSAWLIINLLSHRLLGRFTLKHDKP